MDSVAQHQAAVALEIDVGDMDVQVVTREIGSGGRTGRSVLDRLRSNLRTPFGLNRKPDSTSRAGDSAEKSVPEKAPPSKGKRAGLSGKG